MSWRASDEEIRRLFHDQDTADDVAEIEKALAELRREKAATEREKQALLKARAEAAKADADRKKAATEREHSAPTSSSDRTFLFAVLLGVASVVVELLIVAVVLLR